MMKNNNKNTLELNELERKIFTKWSEEHSDGGMHVNKFLSDEEHIEFEGSMADAIFITVSHIDEIAMNDDSTLILFTIALLKNEIIKLENEFPKMVLSEKFGIDGSSLGDLLKKLGGFKK